MRRGDKWLPGTILSKEGSVAYHVDMSDGKCHTDQLRVCTAPTAIPPCLNSPTVPDSSTTAVSSTVPDPPSLDASGSTANHSSDTSINEPSSDPSTEPPDIEPPVVQPNIKTEHRRSTRARQPVAIDMSPSGSLRGYAWNSEL